MFQYSMATDQLDPARESDSLNLQRLYMAIEYIIKGLSQVILHNGVHFRELTTLEILYLISRSSERVSFTIHCLTEAMV
jgi:hypothetical protein